MLLGQKRVFNLAKFIRKNDWNSEIILIKPKDFILSECWLCLCRLYNVIDEEYYKGRLMHDIKIICDHNFDIRKFNFQNKLVNYNIFFNHILYIKRDTKIRKLIIITECGSFEINMDLKQIFNYLDDRFRQVHKSCIVNCNRIIKFDWTNNFFVLDNGNHVELLSKNYKKNVEDLF